MMGDFQQIGGQGRLAVNDTLFGGKFRVTSGKERGPTKCYPADDRAVVQVIGINQYRSEDLQPGLAQGKTKPWSGRRDRQSVSVNGLKECFVGGRRMSDARHDDTLNRKGIDDRCQSADMIGMRVGRDDHVEMIDPLLLQGPDDLQTLS